MGEPTESTRPESLDAVPLFPLPNVVLFPRAVLPLHVFEQRYKQMTGDALAGNRQIAMALLRPGWEKSYYGRAAVEPVVCVGTIVSAEQLADGKYNFLLQGHTRARIVRERAGGPYRTARLRPMEEVPVLEIDLDTERQRMVRLFSDGALSQSSLGRHFRQMLATARSTPEVCDLVAFNVLDDVAVKQSILAELDVRRRVHATIEALAAVQRMLGPALRPDEVNLN
jgi:uncharacterized protein